MVKFAFIEYEFKVLNL